MHHASLEQIQATSSPRVEGRLNAYFAFTALVLVLFAPSRLAYVSALVCFVALGVDAAGRDYLTVVRLPVYFLLPSLLLVVLFTSGSTALAFGPFSVSWAGLDRSLTTGLRSIGSITILSYLIVTTTVPQLVAALQSLRCPRFVIDVSLLTYRAIQILLTELARLELAATGRLGFRTRRTTLRTSKSLAFSLFLKSLSRAEALNDAMLARGYDGKLPSATTASRGHSYVAVVLGCIAIAGWSL
ncbi:cobalt ECF transporter T component CbiQ [Halorientalis brevis]|uniref:Cobalt ECF transporter T component CbiQ n=1 Tax=Halorientalis brevis TaxID=1126241 RepID=A0ABD6C8M2_9EURY|nr:cobalt ECF transporter T component CbiQ [Halorientalis brevis]